MKTEQPILITSIKASEELEKFYFVNGAGSKADSDHPLGVCNATTSSGEMAPIVLSGVVLVYSGSIVNAGEFITGDDEGRAVPAVDFRVRGMALSTASSANQLITVLLY